jgi:hypothetical protein
LVVNVAAWTCGKCATNGLPAFFEAEDLLVGARADAGEENRFVGQAEEFGERLGDEGGLVVAALAFALAVERDGHNDVGLETLASCEIGQKAGKEHAERLDVFKFEDQDGVDQFALVDGPASGAVEGEGSIFFIAAADAERGLLRRFVGGGTERTAAEVADFFGEGFEGIEAEVADRQAGRFGEQLLAEQAAGGKHDAE